jgi:hypothetical protein
MKKHLTLKESKQQRKIMTERAIILAVLAAAVILILSRSNVSFTSSGSSTPSNTSIGTNESIVVDIDQMRSEVMPDLKKMFGKPEKITTEKRPFHEKSIEWLYDGLVIDIFAFINPIGRDTFQVYGIDITGNNYVTKNGFGIGTAKQEIIDISGTPSSEDSGTITYILGQNGTPAIKYFFEDDKVTRILFYDEQYFKEKGKYL